MQLIVRTNSTTLAIEIQNAPPIPKIRIKDGINLGEHQWSVPANRMIVIDGSVTFDNEGDSLEFFWDIEGQSLFGESIEINFMEQTILELYFFFNRQTHLLLWFF